MGPEGLRASLTQDYLNRQLNRWVPFSPEHLKRILDDFTVKAGVEVRFFTRVVEADVDGRRIKGVVVSNVEGLRFVPAKAVVDATGDAALATLAAPSARWSCATPRRWRPALCAPSSAA